LLRGGSSMALATVLVVDDEVDVRRVLTRVLVRAGFAVLDVDGGFEAIAALRHGATIDVMVTDLEMPGMGGAALLKEVRAVTPGLPVIVLSGLGDPERLSEELGVPCLAKPFRHEALVDTVLLAHGGGHAQSGIVAKHPLSSSRDRAVR
jgi:CheY-like chemotaxis protein